MNDHVPEVADPRQCILDLASLPLELALVGHPLQAATATVLGDPAAGLNPEMRGVLYLHQLGARKSLPLLDNPRTNHVARDGPGHEHDLLTVPSDAGALVRESGYVKGDKFSAGTGPRTTPQTQAPSTMRTTALPPVVSSSTRTPSGMVSL